MQDQSIWRRQQMQGLEGHLTPGIFLSMILFDVCNITPHLRVISTCYQNCPNISTNIIKVETLPLTQFQFAISYFEGKLIQGWDEFIIRKTATEVQSVKTSPIVTFVCSHMHFRDHLWFQVDSVQFSGQKHSWRVSQVTNTISHKNLFHKGKS